MEEFVDVQPLDVVVDGNGCLSFTSSFGLLCRVLDSEGNTCIMELTKQQCIDCHLLTKETFEAALQKFVSALSAMAQHTPQLAEGVPVGRNDSSSQGAPPSTHNHPINNSLSQSAQEIGVPEILQDPNSQKVYQRGRFLGKGGFAKCYELIEMKMKNQGQMITTENIFGGKIVSKQFLMKPHQKDSMAQEITIHRAMKNKHVVGFHSFFEDQHFVYLVLELCKRGSLMELHQRRKAITEPEARYFMFQLASGVKYLHQKHKVIHRNLKLNNIFLNDEMEIKIGEFGLATKLDYDGERKRTLCGTPIYIAPEVLMKKGHSYEVDIWSMGCILYALLVGHLPFEAQTLKDTYAKIKRNEYTIPSRIGPLARALITGMLQAEPSRRPNVDQILADNFITQGYLPSRLPLSCLTTAPRFDSRVNNSITAVRRPLGELNRDSSVTGAGGKGIPVTSPPDADSSYTGEVPDGPSPQRFLRDLQMQLKKLFASKPTEKVHINMDESEDPAAIPLVWVAKWADYSNKYGFGYLLNDDTIGVLFNDLTNILLLPDGKSIQYVERDGMERYFGMTTYPSTMEKKVKLLNYFRSYMREKLIKAGEAIPTPDKDEMTRLPFVFQWFRTSRAVVMYLTNGTLQVNYFNDHVKLIICPLMGAVTVINDRKQFRTFSLASLTRFGCSVDLLQRLEYISEKINILLVQRPLE